MNARASDAAGRPAGEDGSAIQRVVSHALSAEAAGGLPWLPWYLGLSGAEREQVRACWPSAAARWEEIDRLGAPAAAADSTTLLVPLRALLLSHRANAKRQGSIGA